LRPRVFITAAADRNGTAARVFEARFVDKSYFPAQLRPFYGLGRPVAASGADAEFTPFRARGWRLPRPRLPRCEQDDQGRLTSAIGGCHCPLFAGCPAARRPVASLPVAPAHEDFPASGSLVATMPAALG
jgi:hypothetical protein